MTERTWGINDNFMHGRDRIRCVLLKQDGLDNDVEDRYEANQGVTRNKSNIGTAGMPQSVKSLLGKQDGRRPHP